MHIFRHDTHAECVNTEGDFYCTACEAGYFGDGHEMTGLSARGSKFGSGCTDVDECVSGPCHNGATCTDSIGDYVIPANAYRCTCVAGYANGACDYEYISEVRTECTVDHSAASSLTGNCDIDVDECSSIPCANSGACTESSSAESPDFQVVVDAFSCDCVAG